jgi:AcrR family transcriptional regulator
MRYSAQHKQQTRTRLLQQGGARVKQDGFAATGIDGLMAAAGMTSGAFYSNFPSKAALLNAIVEHELAGSLARFTDKNRAELTSALSAYLSASHVANPAEGCPATSLTPEVARADLATRQTFERIMRQINQTLAEHTGNEAAAWAMMAQAIGAVMLARAMASEEAQQALLSAALEQCSSLLGANHTALPESPK